MTVFMVFAALAVVLVLALLLRPYMGGGRTAPQTSHRQLNAAICREQLAKLEQDLADGTLGKEDQAQARAELQRRLLEDTQEEDAAVTLHVPRKTIVAIALMLPVAAVAFYLLIGNPAGMAPLAPVAPKAQDLERMVARLAARLESEPGNLQDWAMLARSYQVMGRSVEAEKAFERAGSFIDDDAEMLANYAVVAAANAGGRFAGKPTELIEKALKVDPANAMALWLAGTAALDRKEYEKAIAIWERLAPQLPPGSEDARMLQVALDEVRASSGKGARPAVVAAAAAASVSGTVELDPALQARAQPGDTVLVIARAPGNRIPLAVLRVPAARLPLKFTLDDSLAMSPQALLSTASEIEVEARISRNGQARPEAGDLLSAVQTVRIGARDVLLRVTQVRP